MEAPQALAARPPSGRKMKAHAPAPPGKPAPLRVPADRTPPGDAALGCPQNLIHQQEALRNSTLDVTVVLPSGLEKQSVVSGSHAMMDLLVELCLQNHLNPSHHALEIRSSETQQPLSFKPNTLVGTLNVHTVFLKEKVPEEKAKPGPRKVPEKSVRLVVNYLRTQKAVVRVSPDAPLRSILPLICAKCDVRPEHVVLLRDSAAGEELELSKSLSELGVKELYAWDNRRVLTKTQSEPSLSCRETFRKSSLGNDETDNEKKKFLGFFKVNKRSNSKGCLTMPNSPSAHARSLSLGPALSLGNISGVSMKSEMKKRRAPPPPGSGPLVQDKTPEKVSLGSQVDLQKKKRRAPAPPPPQPPPPSPLVPNRREDKEENRKSTMGVGRQAPQKPPRGSTRGPPQLVPPPLPPPGPDEVEPLGPPGEGAGSEPSELRPELSLPLSPSSHSGVDGILPVPSEAEETASVGSCFASEDTTEDSGVISSPSDIISLDSQHDSLKSKDKWATDQEDCSDQDLAGTPEPGHQKSPSWEGSGPAKLCLRSEEAAGTTDEDNLLVTGRLHSTLAEPDGGLDGMEGSPGADGSAATQGRSGAWSPSAQGWAAGADAVPVTFIGEVSEEPGPEDCGLWPDQSNGAGPSDAGPGAAQRGAGAPGWREPGRRAPAPRAVPGPPSWCRRGQPAAGRCWREPGLTTYTIVPSHAERRPYARGASPPAGALRIDELGNLVGVPGARAAAPAAPGVDSEEQQPGKVREFWRRGPGAGSAQQAPSPSPAARAPPSPASAPAQPPPSAALARAPPLRPQRRTSSQHVAAAIARRIGAGPAGQRDDKARGPPGSPQPNGGPRLSSAVPGRASREEPATLRRGCGPQEEPCTLDLGTSTVPRAPHSPDPAHAPVPHRLPATGSAQAPTREPPSCPRVPGALEAEAQPCPAPAARHADCSLPTGIFGPKKKFRPVAQKPVRKDTCLHSALMDAIHAAGGKDKLRKTAEPPEERGPRTLSYTEADSERSALLAAIRGHSGTRSLRKVSSSASAELWGCWAAVPPEAPGPLPMPQAPPAPMTAPRTSSGPLGDAVDARQALLDAIRSGSGAARLKKVPLLV